MKKETIFLVEWKEERNKGRKKERKWKEETIFLVEWKEERNKGRKKESEKKKQYS